MTFISKFKFAAIALLIVAQGAVAQATNLDQIFSSSFISGYQSNRCGANIMALIDRADQAGVDLSRANILELRNNGNTVFGMLNAEYARNQGKLLPQPTSDGMKFEPGETNWEFHVVLELDGEIFDFDFGNKPVVANVQDYFDKMFLEEQKGKFNVMPGQKLADYKVIVISAQDYIKRVRQPNETKLSLKDYLKR